MIFLSPPRKRRDIVSIRIIFRFITEAKDFYVLYSVQTGFGARVEVILPGGGGNGRGWR
jgi:hypothetical protein